MNSYDVIIIGAGAAGLTAAARLSGAKIALLDRNGFPGKKLNITGKGRCNLTNDCTADEFFENAVTNGKFLYSAFNAFPPRSVMEMFEGWGVPLKVERGRRVFPVSDKARDITDALAARAPRIFKARAASLIIEDGVLKGADCEFIKFRAPRVIVATGGVSYPAAGSTGDGYELARQAGHTVIPPKASLVPLLSDSPACPALEGLSLRNVTVSSGDYVSDVGEMLFTREGVSGPLILTLSALYDEIPELTIDLKPGLSREKLEARIDRDLAENPAKSAVNALSAIAPKAMLPFLFGESGGVRAGDFSRAARVCLREMLKAFPLKITGKAPIEQAVITSGGVCAGEINPATMESKLLKGLYFAGEVIDVDALTGGYNLQTAFMTAHAAAAHIGKELNL